jgi:TAT (twin-arginine translocation) pathway signal sequence
MTIPPPSSILPLSRRNFLQVTAAGGAGSLVFGTSFGHFDPFMIDLAKKYAKVELRHAAARWDAAKRPKNLGIYVGSHEDNKDKVVIDKTCDNLDPLLGQTDYLLEGVVGATT